MRLHVHEWGDPSGTPLVCLHGISGHAGHFRRLATERWSRFRVVAPDLRGHGSSEQEPPWDLETHVADVLQTVEAAGVPDGATWVGLSFGGRLVLELAARDELELRRVVLLDPAIQILPHVGFDMAEQVRTEDGFASIEEAVELRLISIPTSPRDFVDEDRREQLVEGPDGRFHWRYCPSAVVTGYSELCTPPPPAETLRVPTLIVYAPEFGLVHDEQLDAYRAALGELLQVVSVPGGHMVVWDAYEQTADAIDAFLAQRTA
jgi:lipase